MNSTPSIDEPQTVSEREAILVAICAGDIAYLESQLPIYSKYFASFQAGTGTTFLHTAARNKQKAVCALLIGLGASVNNPGYSEIFRVFYGTPLRCAAEGGSVEMIEFLIKHGAWVDGCPDSTTTPLMDAAMEGHLQAVMALLDAGADINRENPNLHWTALDFAEAYGQGEVADYLISRGAKRLRGEKTDWSNTPGGPYIEFIERQFGPVSFASLGHIVDDGPEVVLRIARGPKKFGAKLLFTVGLARHVGVELGIVLRMDWPMNDAAMQAPRYFWPIRLLFNSVSYLASGQPLPAGGIIDASSPIREGCELPDGYALILSSHLLLTPDQAGLPNTLLFNFVAPPGKKGATPEWLTKTETKLGKAKWNGLTAPSQSLANRTLG